METVKAAFDLLGKIVDKLDTPSSAVSGILLMFTCVGMIALLFKLVGQANPERVELQSASVHRPVDEHGRDLLEYKIKQLQAELQTKNEQLHQLQTNPPYTIVEKTYFNLNGMANSGLILAISFLFWEIVNVKNIIDHAVGRLKMSPQSVNFIELQINDEISRIMATLAGSLVLSGAILLTARVQNGRSLIIINRAFMISLLVSIGAFTIFSFFLSGARG